MKLRNTSRYPDAEIRRLVALATRGVNLASVAVHVKNCSRALAGRAYASVPFRSSAAPTATRLVVLRVGRPEKFPVDNMVTTVRWCGPWRSREEAEVERYRIALSEGGTSRLRTRMKREARGSSPAVREPLFQFGLASDHPYGGKRSPLIVMATWQEGLVALAAHEARHIHQFKHRKPLSEVDCERFAAKALARYREALP